MLSGMLSGWPSPRKWPISCSVAASKSKQSQHGSMILESRMGGDSTSITCSEVSSGFHSAASSKALASRLRMVLPCRISSTISSDEIVSGAAALAFLKLIVLMPQPHSACQNCERSKQPATRVPMEVTRKRAYLPWQVGGRGRSRAIASRAIASRRAIARRAIVSRAIVSRAIVSRA